MIQTLKVSKRFDDFQALYPTDLSVKERSFTAVLGPSGSGKTTLLRIIAGLERSDGGCVKLAGRPVDDPSAKIFIPPEKRNISMVFQDFALWPHMTVFGNVAYGLRARGQTAGLRDRVTEALGMVQLESKAHRYPHELSGGEQQRVAFARAAVTRPKIILLDEPISALDALLREQMRIELKSMVAALGLTALYVTHDQLEAMSMADQIVVMNQGRILQTAAPHTVYNRPEDPFVASFLGRSNWFPDRNKMVRPEHISLKKPENGLDGYEQLRGTVRASGYLGDRYELVIQLDEGGLQWTAYRDAPLSLGTTVNLYVDKKKINRLKENKTMEGA